MATIHYRHCSRQFASITSSNLRDAVAQVMDITISSSKRLRESISARRYACPDQHDVVLNAYYQTNDWVFAEFLRAEPGAFIITVEDDDNDEILRVRQHPAPQGNAPHRGSLYALIYGDHVLFASKGHFSSRNLEDYLTWILQRDSSILPVDRKIVLATRTTSSERLRANSVRVSLAPLDSHDVNADEDTEDFTVRPTPRGLLQTLLVADADLRKLVEGGQVEVDVLLKFKTGKRNRNMSIGDLNHVFRNVDDVEDVSFEGPDGKISGLGARLQGQRNIQLIGSLYDANDARRKLIEQFDDWRTAGHIR
ncbi:hypothetical protein FY136_20640 [Agrobacterium tumefaciens]|uniref:hypothetical protein n=1 Tax=Agrobacterium tumefaciens TaxID=358 RepID=UPI0021CE0162|nr:hypothetical protein [Agrobacterium tumefaciens]UXT51654.1 hypothetical protein FY136_20640 [Agrobacterium tumefaciens]